LHNKLFGYAALHVNYHVVRLQIKIIGFSAESLTLIKMCFMFCASITSQALKAASEKGWM